MNDVHKSLEDVEKTVGELMRIDSKLVASFAGTVGVLAFSVGGMLSRAIKGNYGLGYLDVFDTYLSSFLLTMVGASVALVCYLVVRRAFSSELLRWKISLKAATAETELLQGSPDKLEERKPWIRLELALRSVEKVYAWLVNKQTAAALWALTYGLLVFVVFSITYMISGVAQSILLGLAVSPLLSLLVYLRMRSRIKKKLDLYRTWSIKFEEAKRAWMDSLER